MEWIQQGKWYITRNSWTICKSFVKGQAVYMLWKKELIMGTFREWEGNGINQAKAEYDRLS
jgi:hypothetical protein